MMFTYVGQKPFHPFIITFCEIWQIIVFSCYVKIQYGHRFCKKMRKMFAHKPASGLWSPSPLCWCKHRWSACCVHQRRYSKHLALQECWCLHLWVLPLFSKCWPWHKPKWPVALQLSRSWRLLLFKGTESYSLERFQRQVISDHVFINCVVTSMIEEEWLKVFFFPWTFLSHLSSLIIAKRTDYVIWKVNKTISQLNFRWNRQHISVRCASYIRSCSHLAMFTKIKVARFYIVTPVTTAVLIEDDDGIHHY